MKWSMTNHGIISSTLNKSHFASAEWETPVAGGNEGHWVLVTERFALVTYWRCWRTMWTKLWWHFCSPYSRYKFETRNGIADAFSNEVITEVGNGTYFASQSRNKEKADIERYLIRLVLVKKLLIMTGLHLHDTTKVGFVPHTSYFLAFWFLTHWSGQNVNARRKDCSRVQGARLVMNIHFGSQSRLVLGGWSANIIDSVKKILLRQRPVCYDTMSDPFSTPSQL